jgi:hypothetical protein
MILKEINKTYRLDLKRWEAEYRLFGLITLYRYSILKNGKFRKKWSFRIKDKASARRMKKPNQLPDVVIGRNELQERYNGNKWLVPMNIKYDPNIE